MTITDRGRNTHVARLFHENIIFRKRSALRKLSWRGPIHARTRCRWAPTACHAMRTPQCCPAAFVRRAFRALSPWHCRARTTSEIDVARW